MKWLFTALCVLKGGYDGQHNLKCVEVYNPNTGKWTNAPPMAAHEGGVGVGVVPKYCDSSNNMWSKTAATK